MSATVHEVTRDELEARRAEILNQLGISLDELRRRVDTYTTTPQDWDAWTELKGIAFLLGEDQ